MKKINEMSKSLLKTIYGNFSEKSMGLVCVVNPVEVSTSLNISLENFYLCLWYLESKKLIKEKSLFVKRDASEDNKIEIVFTADGIDLVESMV